MLNGFLCAGPEATVTFLSNQGGRGGDLGQREVTAGHCTEVLHLQNTFRLWKMLHNYIIKS